MRVEGHGPRSARYAIVGEAPGATEARENRPFCGPSGELLHATLAKVGIDPSEVYVTNVYKDYRKGNPTPTNEEIQECIPELAEELGSMSNLEHVLVVGNVPMQALTGRKGGIIKTQGSLLSPRKAMEEALDGVDIMPIMHPAYVLRNNNYQTQNLFQEIMGSFVALGQTKAVENVVMFRSEPDISFDTDVQYVKRASIDLEATPVPWWHEDFRLISAAISFDGETAYVLDLTDSDIYEWFWAWCNRNKQIRWVMHNGSYDRQVLLHCGIDLELLFDTMTAQYLIDPGSRKGLQYMSSMYLGLPPYKDVDYKNILDEPWEKVAEMNGIDAIRTYRLYEHLMPRVRDDLRLARMMKFLMLPAINALMEMELKGMPIDLDRLANVTEEYEAKNVRAADNLRELARKYGMEKFNPRSNKDKQELIFNRIGFPVVQTTDAGKPSLAAAVRKDLLDSPMDKLTGAITMLDEYAVVSQRLGTFLYPWDDMQRDGFIHTKYKPNHVVSGRLSSEKPNMQQVPNDPDIRSIFGGLPGHKLVMLDYSQLELRLAAEFADEPTMLEAYREGEDLHTLTAEAVLRDRSARQVGKILNFSLLYGAGWAKMQEIAWVQYGVKLSDSEAQQLHRAFFREYGALKDWHTAEVAKARARGYAQSPIGRRRYLPNIDNWQDGKSKAHDESIAINHPVQSFGSDLMLSSLTVMHNAGLRVAATVHDSVILLASDDEAATVGKQARDIMENIHHHIGQKFGYHLEVPLVADLNIATHWSK